jgi:hypothetical protein
MRNMPEMRKIGSLSEKHALSEIQPPKRRKVVGSLRMRHDVGVEIIVILSHNLKTRHQSTRVSGFPNITKNDRRAGRRSKVLAVQTRMRILDIPPASAERLEVLKL